DRAVEAADDEKSDEEALRSGMKMVREQFLRTLGEVGVERVVTVGQPFDPERHEAVSNVPVSEPAQDQTVVGEIKALYVLGDEVLRPGVVAVGQLQS
ncbi:MAG: nucleotide exchange factor GrpE, partial [Myxococcota bacterium]